MTNDKQQITNNKQQTTAVSELTELNLWISYSLAVINRYNLANKNYAH
ncbi:MAG: hypothetical protein F6J86_33230 [Symploca sp. SIO1B1]|nr:hypothetical protein [Symploca sp. SIO1B1]